MKKIKNIYCFGTSYTAGGGFEFNKEYNYKLIALYKNLGIPLNQSNFSWPGLMQTLIKSDIKVHNLAKSGYGNERVYRKTLDVIQERNGDVDDSLFIFEFSGLGRKEYYLKELDDYVICNYVFDDNSDDIKINGVANTYFYQPDEITNIVNKNESMIREFTEKTINFKNQIITYERNMLLFINFLEANNINYLINGGIWVNPKLQSMMPENHLNKIMKFRDKDNKLGDFVRYFNSYNLTLEDETRGVVKDGHSGYVGNKIISEMIFNHLIDFGYIQSEKVELTDPTIDLIFEPNGYTPETNFSQVKIFL